MPQPLPQTQYKLFDGAKAISINALPEEAWVTWGTANDDTDERKYYSAVGWLQRCVNIRATALSSVPWAITKGETDVWLSDGTSAPKGLEWAQDMPALLAITEAAISILGQAYWMVIQNKARPLGLRWLAPSTMEAVWDKQRGLVGYKRHLENEIIPLKLEEVVYFALPNAFHETEPGDSPVKAAMKAAGVLYEVDKFATSFFERGAIKATILSVPPASPKAEIEKLDAWWKRMFRGSDKAWETAVTPTGVEPKIVGEGIAELGNGELTREKREDIATTLGVPHSLVFSNAANFATAQQDEANFVRYTIIPETRLVAETLNRQLFSRYGLTLVFRPNELDAMQEDENTRSGSLASLVSSGVPLLTAMDILGYDLTDEQRLAIEQAEEEKRAAAQAMQDMALTAGAEDDSEAAEDEERWQRKSLNALRAGKSAAVTFESRHIDPVRQAHIAHALEHASSEPEVRAVFAASPFRWEGYP